MVANLSVIMTSVASCPF